MSFRCSGCNVAYPNQEHPDERRPTKVITSTRPRHYPVDGGMVPGWEIAGEELLCTPCVSKVQLAIDPLKEAHAHADS